MNYVHLTLEALLAAAVLYLWWTGKEKSHALSTARRDLAASEQETETHKIVSEMRLGEIARLHAAAKVRYQNDLKKIQQSANNVSGGALARELSDALSPDPDGGDTSSDVRPAENPRPIGFGRP